MRAHLSDRVISRLLREGTWRRVASGIYGIRDDSWEQRAWAGLLIGGTDAVLGKQSAAYLDGIAPPPHAITVYIKPEQRIARDDRWSFIRSPRLGGGVLTHTEVPQTVVDLSADLEPDGVVALVAKASRIRPRLDEEVRRILGRHRHRALLLDILSDVDAGAESPLERRYLIDVERAHRLPSAERQSKPSRYRTDAWYRDYGLLVELDGRRYHEGLAASVDMKRDNEHRLLGLTTLRYGWPAIAGAPCQVARQVGTALRRRGWEGAFRPCRRCQDPPRGGSSTVFGG